MKHIKNIAVALGIAFVFVVITYVVMNEHVPLTSEKTKLKLFEFSKEALFPSAPSNITDSVIMIDTYYDQQFVMEYETGPYRLPKGLVPVADRGKLKRCLEYLKNQGDYKYIILDIFFDKEVCMESDSALYQLIASMPNLILAKPQEHELADKCLETKAWNAQYSQAYWEGDFVKYPFLIDNNKSLPLRMYEEMTGRTIQKKGIAYFDKGLSRNSIILTYENIDLDKRVYLGGMVDYPIEEVLDDYDVTDKYIIIGNYEDDLHTTYYGDIPGALINFYAYLALLHGHHRITISIFLFLLFVFALPIYLKLTRYESIKSVYSKVVMNIFKYPILKRVGYFSFIGTFIRNILSYLISPLLGYPLYLTFICWFTYIAFGEAYDILITTTLFYLMDIIIRCYQESRIKKEEYERKTNI
ncbi:MAG: CHASE2 domain-containing protein [Paraprevotella sp.]|nr:CHASE2 domain-containing protein [Paraprevotella sp.]